LLEVLVAFCTYVIRLFCILLHDEPELKLNFASNKNIRWDTLFGRGLIHPLGCPPKVIPLCRHVIIVYFL
jgi:hypothetical protein